MNFEEAIKKLEKITEELEEGNLPLEESIKKFEEGMRLVNFCEEKLEEVEKRIRVLLKENGRLKLKNLQTAKEKTEEDKKKTKSDGFLFGENRENDRM